MTGTALRFVLVVLWTLSGVVLGAPLWVVVVTMVVGVCGWFWLPEEVAGAFDGEHDGDTGCEGRDGDQ